MRILLLIIVAFTFILFCLGALTGSNEGAVEATGYEDERMFDEEPDVTRSRNLPTRTRNPSAGKSSPNGGIAEISGKWIVHAIREAAILMRRAAVGMGQFIEGVNEARQEIREFEQVVPENNSPPYPVQNNAPNPGMERYEREVINDEVGDNENYENSPQKNR